MLNRVHATLLEYHRSMLDDRERTDAYRRAIREVVRPGDVVVDIGTGTGILAHLSCQAGAAHVYAIDDGEILDVAELVTRSSPFADRITLVSEHSTRFELAERADVVVTETLGNIGFEEGILGSVLDARRRFLRPGAAVVPARVALHVAPLELPEAYERIDLWGNDVFGTDYSGVRSYASCNLHGVLVSPPALLGPAARICEVELDRFESTDVRGSAEVVIAREGELHGLAGWFDARLSPSVSLTNAPPNAAPSWSNGFFPLERPWKVARGDRLRIAIRGAKNGSIWRWELDGETTAGRLRADQSTAFAFPIPKGKLRKQDLRFTPRRSAKGEAERMVLESLDGRTTLGELEEALQRAHADLFRSRDDAAEFVRRIVARCGE